MKWHTIIIIVGVGTVLLFCKTWSKNRNKQLIRQEIEYSTLIPMKGLDAQISSFLPNITLGLLEKNTIFQPEIRVQEGLYMRAKISAAEAELKNSQAIDHLNTGKVSRLKRQELGDRLKYLDNLRIKEIEQDLAAIEEILAKLETEHSSRLISYGVNIP